MKIYIAGHSGMVGSAIANSLRNKLFDNKKPTIISRSHKELDLINKDDVISFLKDEKPDKVIVAAARVGGIKANNLYPAEFIYENISIQSNLIYGSYKAGIKDLLFLGSSCIYPRNSKQPMEEAELLTGKLEATNEPYAIAKIAGIKMCESFNRQYKTDFRSVMPTNVYGPGDNFHKDDSHVIPGLIRKFHDAKINKTDEVEVWGTGGAYREFIHVDDLAEACSHILCVEKEIYQSIIHQHQSHINIGTGEEIQLKNLIKKISNIVGFKGKIRFDTSMPDGTPRKLLDSTLLKELGWKQKILLNDGLKETYDWFLENIDTLRK